MGLFDWFKPKTTPVPPKKTLKESWGDLYMPQQYIADVLNRANSGYLGVGIWANNNPRDRAYGADYPFVRNEQDLALMRNASRYCYRTNANAAGVINALTSYVISTGFSATCKSDTDQDLANQCQLLISKWMDQNNFEVLQEEIFKRTRIDGEMFLRIHPQEDGHLAVRFVEPECITQPGGTTQEEYLFGIKTDPLDTQNIKEYNIRYYADEYQGLSDEAVKPDYMIHLKVNCNEAMKRGIPDFSFSTLEMFNLAAKLQRNIGEGAAVQAAIAAIRQHEDATVSQVQDFLDTQIGATPTPPFPYPGMMPTAFGGYEQIQPGTFIDMPNGSTYKEPPGASNVEPHLQALQAVLRTAGMRWSAPEWLVSSRSDSMSYASSLTAESPFLKACMRMQRDYKKVFRLILEKVLENASLAGEIPLEWRDIVAIDIAPPAMEVRDKGAEARANQIYYEMAIKSKHTICSELGMNYAREQEFIAQEYKNSNVPPEAAYAQGQNGDNEAANKQKQGPINGDAKTQTTDQPVAVDDKDGSKQK